MSEPLRAVVLGPTEADRADATQVLGQLGCRVIHTDAAYEAFRQCCDGPADVLYVTLGEDPSEALDLATTLRANALTNRVLIVVHATRARTFVLLSALSESIDDVLWHPIELDEIKARLSAHFRRIRATRAATRSIDEEERLRERRIDCLRLVAHDLNNPLTAIRILAEMLVNEFSDNEIQQDLRDVLEAADLAACIIESMSRMVRLEAPDESMTGFPVDIGRIAAQVVRRPAFRDNCKLHEDGNDATMCGDRNAIQQAITDVLLNARRMCDGKEGMEVRVGVDNGVIAVECGVPSAWVPSAPRDEFTDLFGAVELRAERIPVAASGLAYADYVARYHGGRVVVNGLDGVTTVRLTLSR